MNTFPNTETFLPIYNKSVLDFALKSILTLLTTYYRSPPTSKIFQCNESVLAQKLKLSMKIYPEKFHSHLFQHLCPS